MFRIGHSYDIHQLAPDQELILGGIKIDSDLGTIAHSDGDVLVHVIIESIIGALALGDIGCLYPDTDQQYKDVCSLELLKDTIKRMEDKGYKINNIDCSIYLQTPKLRPYIGQMRNILKDIMHIDIEQINIKATRGEGIGFIGRKEGIAAEAVVLLTND